MSSPAGYAFRDGWLVCPFAAMASSFLCAFSFVFGVGSFEANPHFGEFRQFVARSLTFRFAGFARRLIGFAE